jgi:hypothetical protein
MFYTSLSLSLSLSLSHLGEEYKSMGGAAPSVAIAFHSKVSSG